MCEPHAAAKGKSALQGIGTAKTTVGIRDAYKDAACDRSDISHVAGVHLIQHYVSKILPEF